MIEYALLVMLGFCAAGLLALLIAPTIWNRAVRLTTKRLDATLPMSLSDIEADKDLLRASYAIRIRRLEAALNKARDKSAIQLVDISKLQMAIGEMRDRAGTLEQQLEERRNAANVFERTIKKRFPEMETALSAAKAALDERSVEIADLNNKLRRKEEALNLLQRASSLQQSEIRRLRESLEGNAADRTGRFKKRPAQWSLDEFRSEYDRLSLELSKMREQLALAHERETAQVAVLRAELQNLAEQIMNAAATREKQAAPQRASETPPASSARPPAPQPRRHMPAERLTAPQPWPGGMESTGRPAPMPARPDAAEPRKAEQQPARPEAAPSPSRPAEARRPSIADEASSSTGKPEASALKALLDRATSAARRDKNAPDASVPVGIQPSPVMRAPPAAAMGSAASSGSATAVIGEGARSEAAKAEQKAPVAPSADPNMDRMLREIFDGRGSGPVSAPSDTVMAAQPSNPESAAAKQKSEAARSSSAPEPKAADKAEQENSEGNPQSLTERLRVI
jgi:hypothetical protein